MCYLDGESILYELVSGEKPEQSHSMNNEINTMIDQLSIYSSQEYVANPSYDSSQPTYSYPNQSYPPPNHLEPNETDFVYKSLFSNKDGICLLEPHFLLTLGYSDAFASHNYQGTSILMKSSSMPELAMNRSRDDGKADNLLNCLTRSRSLNWNGVHSIPI